MQVRWYRSLEDVAADCCTFYIAHEFLDALPVRCSAGIAGTAACP